ncbi:MAG: L,D-transpeptidase [Solirubrobacteraceae bacterium]
MNPPREPVRLLGSWRGALLLSAAAGALVRLARRRRIRSPGVSAPDAERPALPVTVGIAGPPARAPIPAEPPAAAGEPPPSAARLQPPAAPAAAPRGESPAPSAGPPRRSPAAAPPAPTSPVATRPVRLRRMSWGAGVMLVSMVVGLVLAAALGAVLTGGSSSSAIWGAADRPAQPFSPASLITPARIPPGSSVIAHVHADRVAVYAVPDRRLRPHVLDALRLGARALPLVLLVERRRPGWLEVELPVRPNLSSGWIRSNHVSLHSDPFRVQVELSAHRLILWQGLRVVDRQRIGVGAAVSPTPHGRYFVTSLLRPPNPSGIYGPYAFGLSAYSPVYTTFAGGDGQIGLHGTDDPAGIGHDVSHGCIRVANPEIVKLARLLPVGTPVLIGA